MPAGRPTSYNKEILAKANEYLENYKDYGDMIPSVVGLACELDRPRSRLYAWAEKYTEFRDILEKINVAQHRCLVNGGLDSSFNSNITKLVLGKHGYHERTEQTGADGGPIQTETKWQIDIVHTDAKADDTP